MGTGLFISELIRNRRVAIAHVEELKGKIKLREDAEENCVPWSKAVQLRLSPLIQAAVFCWRTRQLSTCSRQVGCPCKVKRSAHISRLCRP